MIMEMHTLLFLLFMSFCLTVINFFLHNCLIPFCLQVVGPPGTGKTDVAVQIISNLYHNFPEQRTLIVTHSNQVSTLKLKDMEKRFCKHC